MKKLLFLLVALFAFVAIQAQTVTTNIPTGNTYATLTTDYTLSAATVRYFVFNAPQHYKATQDYIVNMDTIVGTNHTTVSVQLQGQKSPLKADWTNIGSAVVWAVTGADTTIVISNTTATRYRNYRVSFTGVGTGAVSKIDAQELKIWLE